MPLPLVSPLPLVMPPALVSPLPLVMPPALVSPPPGLARGGIRAARRRPGST